MDKRQTIHKIEVILIKYFVSNSKLDGKGGESSSKLKQNNKDGVEKTVAQVKTI